MRRTIPLLATMALTLLVASGLALVAGVGSATADSSVVGPGESIQKAIRAADPGDTIVVRGVHREDVVIRKDGIKLRGEDAVIEAPTGAKADSPCSRAFGTEAICVFGDTNETGELTGPRVKGVSVSGFTIRGFNMAGKGGNQTFAIDFYAARNATVVGNRIVGNVTGGIAVGKSVDSTVAKNHVIGSPETTAGGIHIANGDRNTTVVKNVLRSIPEGVSALEVEDDSIDTTVAGNDLVDTWLGVYVENTPGTKILSNDVSRAGFAGMFMFGPKQANNATVLANHVSGADFGFLVANSHGGTFGANELHNNCAGVVFISTFGGPVGDYEVKGNTVTDNTRSCPAEQGSAAFSGIGIALLGAHDMEVTANHLSGNVPSGPTAVSGGVVVAKDRIFGGTTKPNNNTVSANHFGRNRPDIFWDKSGTGNRFVANLCNTSVPTRLCN